MPISYRMPAAERDQLMALAELAAVLSDAQDLKGITRADAGAVPLLDVADTSAASVVGFSRASKMDSRVRLRTSVRESSCPLSDDVSIRIYRTRLTAMSGKSSQMSARSALQARVPEMLHVPRSRRASTSRWSAVAGHPSRGADPVVFLRWPRSKPSPSWPCTSLAVHVTWLARATANSRANVLAGTSATSMLLSSSADSLPPFSRSATSVPQPGWRLP
jgi:hypothetical protein